MTYKDMLKQAETEGSTKDLTPTFMEFRKKGEQIIGKFISVNEVTGAKFDNPFNMYVFDTDEGLVKFSLGGASDKDIGVQFREEGIYSIVCDGQEVLPNKTSVNKFKAIELLEPGSPDSERTKEEDVPF